MVSQLIVGSHCVNERIERTFFVGHCSIAGQRTSELEDGMRFILLNERLFNGQNPRSWGDLVREPEFPTPFPFGR